MNNAEVTRGKKRGESALLQPYKCSVPSNPKFPNPTVWFITLLSTAVAIRPASGRTAGRQVM